MLRTVLFLPIALATALSAAPDLEAANAAESRAGAAPAYPNRPVRIIVGFPAGSGTDMLARFVGAKLSLAF